MPRLLCPCGSGLPWASCAPEPVGICRECEQPYHAGGNRAQRCLACRVIRNRELTRLRTQRYRRRRRARAALLAEIRKLRNDPGVSQSRGATLRAAQLDITPEVGRRAVISVPELGGASG